MTQQPEDSSRRPTLANASLQAAQKARITMANQVLQQFTNVSMNNIINDNTLIRPPKRNSMQSSDPYIPNVTFQTQQLQAQFKLENTFSLGI